jgi:hypothetical protein
MEEQPTYRLRVPLGKSYQIGASVLNVGQHELKPYNWYVRSLSKGWGEKDFILRKIKDHK